MSRSSGSTGPRAPVTERRARTEATAPVRTACPTGRSTTAWGPLGTTLVVLLVLVVVGGIVADVLTDVVVRPGRLPRRLRQGADDQGRHLPSWQPSSPAARRRQPRRGLPHPPLYIPVTPAQQVLEQYRRAIEPLRRVAVVVIPVVLGLLAGSGSMGALAHLPPVGQPRALRHQGPPVRAWTSASSSSPCRGCASSSASSRSCSRRRSSPGPSPTTSTAGSSRRPRTDDPCRLRAPRHPRRAHRADPSRLLLARPLLPRDGEGSLLTGITYTDDNAVLPTKAILAVAAIMCAGFPRRDLEPQLAAADHGCRLLVVTAVSSGARTPALIQSLKVNPSEKSLEAPYIDRNIGATRTAFGLDRVTASPTPGGRGREQGRPARRGQRHPRRAHHRPQRRGAHLPPARGPARLLRLPRHPRRRPLHHRRADPRRRRGGARDQPRRPARQPAQLAQRHTSTPTATASTPPTATSAPRGRPGLLRGRRALRLGSTSPAHLLRRAVPELLRRRPPSGARREFDFPGATAATCRSTTRMPVPAVSRSAPRCAGSPTPSSTARPTSSSPTR